MRCTATGDSPQRALRSLLPATDRDAVEQRSDGVAQLAAGGARSLEDARSRVEQRRPQRLHKPRQQRRHARLSSLRPQLRERLARDHHVRVLGPAQTSGQRGQQLSVVQLRRRTVPLQIRVHGAVVEATGNAAVWGDSGVNIETHTREGNEESAG